MKKMTASLALKHAENIRGVVRSLVVASPIYLALVALADEVFRLRGKLAKKNIGR